MGGIADYSGALVLQLPIDEATLVAIQKRPDRKIKIFSYQAQSDKTRSPFFEMQLNDFLSDSEPISYQAARQYFKKNQRTNWAAYVAGVFIVLMKEKKITFPHGASLLIHSSVPEGKGVSSSAALEVAAMQAVAALYRISLEPQEIAALCQKVENLVVGAACGIMDQMTATTGKADKLMALLCQPAQLKGFVDIPQNINFWGLDSGERHSVSGSDYSSVRIGAFMGYRMIAAMAGLKENRIQNGIVVRDPLWNGYLANISPSLFEQRFAAKLPTKISGNDFIKRYSATTDTVTRIDTEKTYAVRFPTRHPIYEHFRVQIFEELLTPPVTESKLKLMGELMYQSHLSYSNCGLGSKGTDLLVRLVRESGSEGGLFGAKITGGGSGGTVVVLGKADAEHGVQKVAEQYEKITGYRPYIFRHSSCGAVEFGVLEIRV
ncbi:MAG TPA: GHMP kinase [bacterium]|nr:GHMP kinase [bacterium]